ncbi:hypothetical protein ACS0TY_021085 [Phlomoides rotata]
MVMRQIEGLCRGAHEYLRAIYVSKWTFSHDGDHHYGVMTTNISEEINGVLKGTRRLPITAIYIVDSTGFVSECYSTIEYALTYSSGFFAPLPDVEEWGESNFQ